MFSVHQVPRARSCRLGHQPSPRPTQQPHTQRRARRGGPDRGFKKGFGLRSASSLQAAAWAQHARATQQHTHSKVPSTTAIHAHFDSGPTPVLLLILGPAWLGPPRSRSQLGWVRVSTHVDPMIPKKEKTHDHRPSLLCVALICLELQVGNVDCMACRILVGTPREPNHTFCFSTVFIVLSIPTARPRINFQFFIP